MKFQPVSPARRSYNFARLKQAIACGALDNPKTGPRWMKATSPLQIGMRCEGGGCQHLMEHGDWYWRDGPGFALCERCAADMVVTTGLDGARSSYVIPQPPRD